MHSDDLKRIQGSQSPRRNTERSVPGNTLGGGDDFENLFMTENTNIELEMVKS